MQIKALLNSSLETQFKLLKGRRGGLAVVCRSGLKVKELSLFDVTFFEYIAVKVVSSPPLLF